MIITFNLVPHPTCISRFLNRFVSPPPTFPISSSFRCITSTLHPIPTYFPGMERRPLGHIPPPPSAILCRLLCTPRRVTVSAVVSCIVRLPQCRSQPAPRSLSDPGGSPTAGPSAYLCIASLPVCCSDPRNLLGLDFSGCHFRARRRVLGASTPCKLLVLPPAPLLHVHFGAVRLPSPL